MNRFFACILLIAALGLLTAAPLQAAMISWTGVSPGGDDFAEGTNWEGGVAPGIADQASIFNGGKAILNTAYVIPSGTYNPYRIYVGGNNGGSETANSGTLEIQTGGSMSIDTLYLGNETATSGKVAAALGKLVMTGGTLDVIKYIRFSGASQSIVDLSGDAIFTFRGSGDAWLGGGYNFGATNQTGVIKLAGSSQFNHNANTFYLGIGLSTSANSGYLSIRDNATYNGTGSSALRVGGNNSSSAVNGFGVIDQSSGTFNVGTGGLHLGTGAGSYGVFNMTGGIANIGSTSLNLGYRYGGTGIMTLSNNAQLTTAKVLVGTYNEGAPLGILNLGAVGSTADASVLTVNAIGQHQAGSTGYLNFHGGTLKANLDTTAFLSNTNPIDGIYVYSENAKIDTNGYNVTIAANSPLLAPSGDGVTAIPVSGKGSGYIGAPVVQITGGGGTGATAYAVMNGDQVDSIVISNPGVNYTSSPTVTLVGGGGSGVTLGTPSLAANVSGGLIKSGPGTLTLAAANTYTGTTNVNAGTLRIAHAGALPGTATINTDATLSLAADMTVAGKILGSTGNVSVDSGNVTYGSNAFTGTLIANGGNLDLAAAHPGTAYVNNGFSWYHNGVGTVAGMTTVGNPLATNSQDALLGGTGTLGNVTVLSNWGNSLGIKGGLEAGQNGAGSLKMANLTFNGPGFVYVGNATLGIGAYTGANAAIIASGALTIGTEYAGTVQFDLGGANIASGTYHLIQHNGAINYFPGSSITNFQVLGAVLSARQTASIVDNAGSGSTRFLDYVVTGDYPVWSGLVGSTTNNNWTPNDHAVTNWKSNTNGSAFFFIDSNDPAATGYIGDAVLFNDAAGTAHSTVTIPANVAPISATVDNTMTYTFNGPGGIVDGPSMTKTTLLKKNSGVLVLNTPNTYSGGTTINDGTIRVGNQTALGAGGVTFFPNAPATAKLQLFGNSVSLSGLITDAVAPGTPVVENGGGGDATLTLTNATANTYAGLLQDGAAGKLGVTFAGSGKFTLSGVNTYSGDTTLSDYGSLAIGIDNALPHGAGKGNLVFAGGSLDLNGHNLTVNGLPSTAAIATITNTVNGTTATFAVGDNDASSSIFGSLLDNGTGILALEKIGVGTLTLYNPADLYGLPSTYSGGTTLTAGMIQTGYNTALGNGDLTMAAGSTLELQSNALTIRALSGQGTIRTTASAILTVNSPATAYTAFVGLIENGSGTLGLTKSGNGTLVLGLANTYTGVTKLDQTSSTTTSTLIVPVLANGGEPSSIGSSSADSANLVFNGGILKYIGAASVTTDRGFYVDYNWTTIDSEKDLTFTGLVTSTDAHGALIKAGSGTLSLTNPNNAPDFYQLQVNQGVLNLSGDSSTVPTYKNLNDLYIGANGYSAALKLSNADLLMTTTSNTAGTIRIGYLANSSGYLPIKDGVSIKNITNGSRIYVAIHDNSTGVIDQTGGSLVMGSLVTLGGAVDGWGVWNMTGGTAELNTYTGNGFRIGDSGTGVGIMTVSGTANLLSHSRIHLGTYGTCTGILNLGAVGSTSDASVFATTMLGRFEAGTTGYINFHGGTLQALADTDTFFTSNYAPTATYIYGEGAKIDTQAFNITIGAPLSKPTGQGVASIPVTDGGSGFIGAPVVKILGGGGTGATAYAVMNGDKIDHIVISNPGTGYTSEPTIVVQGGGGTGATVGALGFVDNGASNGGLIKLGEGTLTLNGALSYTGDTTVAAGTLNANTGINTPAATVWVATGSTLNATSIVADTLNIGGTYSAAAAVPEPAAWLLILTGLLALGFARRLIRRG